MPGPAADRFLRSRRRDDDALVAAAGRIFPPGSVRAATGELRSWPGYAPTPLVELDGAGAAGAVTVGRILLKLERERFGLGSFKVLGGAYAVGRHAARDPDGSAAYVCGSAGNHGLSVAWGARRVGRRATVFVPAGTSDTRIARLRAQGADVQVVSGDYDEALRRATEAASAGAVAISDFSAREDAGTAPVMWGYALIVEEIAAAGVRPTHVFVPAGVGSLAASVVAACRHAFGPDAPQVIVVEPADAGCVFHSLRSDRRTTIPAPRRTRLAPLACRVPSADAWPLLAAGVAGAVMVTDEEVRRAGDLLPDPPADRDNCGAAALAGFLALASEAEARAALGMGADATVVALITE